MWDPLRVRYDRKSGALELFCDDQTFARLRDNVLSDPAVAAAIGEGGDIRQFYITMMPANDGTVSQARDRIALLACGVVASVILFILVMGVRAILGWVK